LVDGGDFLSSAFSPPPQEKVEAEAVDKALEITRVACQVRSSRINLLANFRIVVVERGNPLVQDALVIECCQGKRISIITF